MIKNRVAATELGQHLADAVFKLIDADSQQGGRSLIEVSGPLTIVHSANIEMIFENVVFHGSQNPTALLRREEV